MFAALARYINDITEDFGVHMNSLVTSLHLFIEVCNSGTQVMLLMHSTRLVFPRCVSPKNALQLGF